jgi:hypothetical protein
VAGFSADTGALPRLGPQLHSAAAQLGDLSAPHGEAGRVVVATAAPPRRSGYLASSLTATTGPDGPVFASNARYWTYVHYGAPRRNMRAHPFYPEAIEATRDQLVAIYADHAQQALDTIG